MDTNLPQPTGTVNFTVVGGPFDGQIFRSPIFVGSRPNTAFGAVTEIRSNVFSDIVNCELPLDNQRAPGYRRT